MTRRPHLKGRPTRRTRPGPFATGTVPALFFTTGPSFLLPQSVPNDSISRNSPTNQRDSHEPRSERVRECMPRRHGIARRRASASLRLWRSLLLVTVAASACDGGVGRCESSAWLRGARPPDGPSVDALHRLVDVLHHPPLRGGGRRHVSGVKVESGRAGAEAASHKSAHDSHSCVARAAVKKDRKRGRHCPGTDGVRTGEERRLGKKIRVRREGADTHRQRSSDKRSAEKSSKRRKKKSSTKDKEGRKKRRTKDKEGRECTEPQAAPEPAAPKTSVAPKPEEGLDKKPQGMALARKLMTKMGWGGDGHGLGKNATGAGCIWNSTQTGSRVVLASPASLLCSLTRSHLSCQELTRLFPYRNRAPDGSESEKGYARHRRSPREPVRALLDACASARVHFDSSMRLCRWVSACSR